MGKSLRGAGVCVVYGESSAMLIAGIVWGVCGCKLMVAWLLIVENTRLRAASYTLLTFSVFHFLPKSSIFR